MFPFILMGRVIARLSKKDQYSIYFFFPFFHVGGAEKVHYQIAQAFAGKKCIIYFTRKSKGQNFLEEFRKAGFIIRDISKFTDNKLLYPVNFIFRGILSSKINRNQNDTLVFNGQSNFGYKIAPWISNGIPQIDLIHALCSFSTIRIPFLEFYKTSVTVSQEIIDKHNQLYKKYKVPERLLENIRYVNYGIELPLKMEKTNYEGDLKILYVGRGSVEKRIHLIAQIAKAMDEAGSKFIFSFLGDVEKYIPGELKTFCTLFGTITNPNEVDRIYRDHNLLLVTSHTESGPLVVMEAMARGLCIMSTPVGIVNEHISNRNGFVFSSIGDEGLIIEEAIRYINRFADDVDLQKNVAAENIKYAYDNFSLANFQESYRKFFKTVNPSL